MLTVLDLGASEDSLSSHRDKSKQSVFMLYVRNDVREQD